MEIITVSVCSEADIGRTLREAGELLLPGESVMVQFSGYYAGAFDVERGDYGHDGNAVCISPARYD